MGKVNMKELFRRILKDIEVEMTDEFDQNFERQGFFSEAWARRRSPLRQGSPLLIDTGKLRRSVHSRTTADSITFYTDLPYAAIHNEGGDIKVTRAMKAHFWKKYYEAVGSFGRRKDGGLRQDKRTRRLTTAAEFYRAMALKKVGSVVRIPRRRFLGVSPEVEKAVREIVEEELGEYFGGSGVTIETR